MSDLDIQMAHAIIKSQAVRNAMVTTTRLNDGSLAIESSVMMDTQAVVSPGEQESRRCSACGEAGCDQRKHKTKMTMIAYSEIS